MAIIADKLAPRAAKIERRELLPMAMVATATVAVLAVIVLILAMLWLSVTTGNPSDPALIYTFHHYAEIFLDPFTYTVLGNTLMFAAVTLVVALAVALPMAWLVERTDFPMKSLVFALLTWRCSSPASRWRSAGCSCCRRASGSSTSR